MTDFGIAQFTISAETPDPDDCHLSGDCPTNLYFYHPDHLGSSTFLTDESGDPYQFFMYLPFGETMIEQRASGAFTPYKYNAKEMDEETGLYYYGARYYDARLSRFLSVDPAANEYPEWSPYHYVHNNPLKYTDPTGMRVDSTYTLSGGVLSATSGEGGENNHTVTVVNEDISPAMNGHQEDYTFEGSTTGLTREELALGIIGAVAEIEQQRIASYVKSRGFSGSPPGQKLNSGRINSLRYDGGYGVYRGRNVPRLNNFMKAGAAGVSLYGYANTAQSVYNGDISMTRGIIDAGVITYSWKGGTPGLAVGVGYGVLGPMVVGSEWYKSNKTIQSFKRRNTGGLDGLFSTNR